MSDHTEIYKVSFALSRVAPTNRGEIVIYKMPGEWNDFTYKIRCGIIINSPDSNITYDDELFIGFISLNNNSTKQLDDTLYNSIMNAYPYLAKKGESNIHFFTMLPSISAYRRIVSTFGPDMAQEILKSINDVVYYKGKNASWYEKSINSEAFSLGFMRNSEPFYAFNNADSVLDGVEEENYHAISQKLTLTFSLEGFQNDHQLKLSYNSKSCIPRRINIIIGKNGLGKSQALNSFCRAALRYKDTKVSLTDDDNNGRPMINRLLAIATPGETQNTFPYERKKSQKLYYRRLTLTRNGKTTQSINELLVQLARSDDEIAGSSRWSLFTDSLSKILPLNKIVVTLNDNTTVPITDFGCHTAEKKQLTTWSKVDSNTEPKLCISDNLYPLSSGQLTFLKFSLLCCLYIENGSFVLLDEPETHMHPNMISDFIDLLDFLLEETGSLALIATHSAYLVREVAQEQVHVFKSEQDRINILQPRLATFGAPVDSISRFVFDEEPDSKLTTKLYEKIRTRNLTFDEVESEFQHAISIAALMDIRRRMES